MIWTSKTINVDIDTGEIITKHDRDRNYIIIKKNKHVRYNEINSRGYITYTVKCRNKQQTELPFD